MRVAEFFGKWRIWLNRQIIGDVLPEDALCEFDCRRAECQFHGWAHCKNRLAYLELVEREAASKPVEKQWRRTKKLRAKRATAKSAKIAK
jgi:hypothetical protein